MISLFISIVLSICCDHSTRRWKVARSASIDCSFSWQIRTPYFALSRSSQQHVHIGVAFDSLLAAAVAPTPSESIPTRRSVFAR